MSQDHSISDKRKKKPKVYRVKDINQDITITEIETYKNGKGELRFDTPNIVAIFLNASDNHLLNAKKIYQFLIRPKQSNRERITLNESETAQLYNYLEHIQTAIVTLYSGIECLSNILIPSAYYYEESRGDEIVKWDKTEIERRKSTREKLKSIIPNALKIKSPTGFKCWTRFTQFETLRNEIVHVKSSGLTNKEVDKKIISLLISESVFNKIKAGKELVMELSKEVPYHYEYPILKNSELLIPIEIETWNDTRFVLSD